MTKRYVLSGTGTHGDLLPLVSVAAELMRRGHECHVLANASAAEAARQSGVPFVAIADPHVNNLGTLQENFDGYVWPSYVKTFDFLDDLLRQSTDVELVNLAATSALTMAAGQVERWRIVNAASARYVRLSIGGRPFALLGTTGGLLEAPVRMTEILLTPAGRVDIAVGPFVEGETIFVEALKYERGTIARAKTVTFATVQVGSPAPSTATIPTTLRHIEPLVSGATTPTREVHLGEKASLTKGVRFFVNGEEHHRDDPVKLGQLQVWDIVNDSMMDHPFHLHGYFFQVVSVNGEPPAFRSWEDMVNIPPKARVRIAWMPDDRPGEWMYHCHILEHHEAGMMGHFAVVP